MVGKVLVINCTHVLANLPCSINLQNAKFKSATSYVALLLPQGTG